MIAILFATAMSFDTGNTLYEKCRLEDPLSQALCVAYISGVSDFMTVVQDTGISKKMACVPATVTRGQMEDIVMKDFRDDPAIRNQPAAGLVASSLMKAFPCPR